MPHRLPLIPLNMTWKAVAQVLVLGLLMSIALVDIIACMVEEPTPCAAPAVETEERREQRWLAEHIRYHHDVRSDLCFATYTVRGYVMFVLIPCDHMPR